MLNICRNCGGVLFETQRELNEALKSGNELFICRYCQTENRILISKKAHLDRGFEFLSAADFHKAQQEFGEAIQQYDGTRSKDAVSPDAYLGYALAQFMVQTVFKDDESYDESIPEMVCYSHNNTYIADNENFKSALRCVERMNVGMGVNREIGRLRQYAARIDGIKSHYDAIASKRPKNFRYGAFIAYEDEYAAGAINKGFEVANKVRNMLADKIPNIYLPDIAECGNDADMYEAEILYALEHTRCMLVITDNNIAPRLMRIYSRFLNRYGGKDDALGFVRYLSQIKIALPNSDAKNVFDLKDEADIMNYVCLLNGIDPEREQEQSNKPIEEPQPQVEKPAIPPVADNMLAFGCYPQKRVDDADVKSVFSGYPNPMDDESGIWTVMYADGNGPYCWYRDEAINKKKYRAVYFIRYREVYCARKSSVKSNAQRRNGYTVGKIYCFEFMPLIWREIGFRNGLTYYATDVAIDSREFNAARSGDWEYASLHDWLEDEFLRTAFNDEECERLYRNDDDDRIFLPSEGADLVGYCGKNGRAVSGSDYMQCVGGMCMESRAVNCFWALGKTSLGADEAYVVFPYAGAGVSRQFADMTTVAIVPKIILRQSNKD